MRKLAGSFWLVLLVSLVLALGGCAPAGGGGGGNDDSTSTEDTSGPDVPVDSGPQGITIHWPDEFSNPPAGSMTNAMVSDTTNIGNINVTVFESDGTPVDGATGQVTATNQTATIAVPVNDSPGYKVCAIVVVAAGVADSATPEPIIRGGGCVSGVTVLADQTTSATITLSDTNASFSMSGSSPYAFGATPDVTFTAPGLPGDPPLAPVGATIRAVSVGYPGTSDINATLCTISSGDSCTVASPGLGDNFSSTYTSAQSFALVAQMDASVYTLASTHPNHTGQLTLWPVDSAETPTTTAELKPSGSYTVNPSATGGIDVGFD